MRVLGTRFQVGTLLLLTALLALPASAQLNALYIQSNISAAGQNSVLGFSVSSSGALTPLPGSPYMTGGTGWTIPQGQQLGLQGDEDQQIVVNKAGTMLFTVNGNSNNVSAFLINSDGSLSSTGAPVSSAGSQPASLGLFDGVLQNGGSLLAVVNKSSDASQNNPPPPNFVSMTVNTSGVVKPNVGSKVVLPLGSSPSQISAGPSSIAFVQQFMGSPATMYAYRIRSNGTFELLSSQPMPLSGNIFLGQLVNPNANIVYESIASAGMIAIYSFGPKTGATRLVGTVPTPGMLPCWLAMNSAGTRMYVSETGSSTVSVFDITNPTAPVVLQELNLAATGNIGPWNIAVDPTNKFVFVITGTSLHILSVQADGTLNESVSPFTLPVPAGTLPYGLATVLK